MKILNTKPRLVHGDFTDLDVDAMVNAANSHLILGAGVAGRFAEKADRIFRTSGDRIGGTPVGTAVITGGGRLKDRHVIQCHGSANGGRKRGRQAEGNAQQLESG